jgi:Tfp pilus assembly protein PilF
VVAAEPAKVYPRLTLAQTHFYLNEFDQARELLESVVRQDPDSFEAHNLLGLIYSDQGQTAQALEAFKKAVSIQEDARTYQMLGFLYTKENRAENAARALEKAVELEPDSAIAHLYLANAYMLLGQKVRGEEELRKALSLDPSLREQLP